MSGYNYAKYEKPTVGSINSVFQMMIQSSFGNRTKYYDCWTARLFNCIDKLKSNYNATDHARLIDLVKKHKNKYRLYSYQNRSITALDCLNSAQNTLSWLAGEHSITQIQNIFNIAPIRVNNSNINANNSNNISNINGNNPNINGNNDLLLNDNDIKDSHDSNEDYDLNYDPNINSNNSLNDSDDVYVVNGESLQTSKLTQCFNEGIFCDLIIKYKLPNDDTNANDEREHKRRKINKNDKEKIYNNEAIFREIRCHKIIVGIGSKLIFDVLKKPRNKDTNTIITINFGHDSDSNNNSNNSDNNNCINIDKSFDDIYIKKFISFLYNNKIEINNNEIIPLIELALIFKSTTLLIHKLLNIILKKHYFNDTKCIALMDLIHSRLNGVKEIEKAKNKCLEYIATHLQRIVKTDAYTTLVSTNPVLANDILLYVANKKQ